MILSTDVASSQETLVLEILPLPSKPIVEAASFQSFEEIQRLIWNEGLNQFTYGDEGQARSGSVEVVFHEEIGAHNITVVKATDTVELVAWMGSFLAASGVDAAVSLGDFEPAAESYMNRGFRYYVLDLITVSPEERSVDPILYRFDSDFLYYPLVITSPLGGETEITLFVLTEDKVVGDLFPFHKANYRVLQDTSGPIEFMVSKGDLSTIDLRISEIFRQRAWLAVLTTGPVNVHALNRDFMVSSYIPPPEPTANISLWFLAVIVVVSILLGAASTLAGVVATLFMTRPRRQGK